MLPAEETDRANQWDRIRTRSTWPPSATILDDSGYRRQAMHQRSSRPLDPENAVIVGRARPSAGWRPTHVVEDDPGTGLEIDAGICSNWGRRRPLDRPRRNECPWGDVDEHLPAKPPRGCWPQPR